jgi:hypothetical protein
MTTKLKQLKEELKFMAKELKTSKPIFKSQQKELKYYDWRTEEGKQFNKSHWKLDRKISSLKFQYRHKFITYCLLRGRLYEQIEKRVHENNKPNWNFIRGLQDEYSG